MESPGLRWTRRARTTTPFLFSVRSGVSKKATCRICASSESMPRLAMADRRLESGTLNFNSTLSAPRSRRKTSASCSVDKRVSVGFAAAVSDRSPTSPHMWSSTDPPGVLLGTRNSCQSTLSLLRVGRHHPCGGGSGGNPSRSRVTVRSTSGCWPSSPGLVAGQDTELLEHGELVPVLAQRADPVAVKLGDRDTVQRDPNAGRLDVPLIAE